MPPIPPLLLLVGAVALVALLIPERPATAPDPKRHPDPDPDPEPKPEPPAEVPPSNG